MSTRAPSWIGRDGVAVDDPFNRYRGYLGDAYAAAIDAAATDLAAERRLEDDADLEQQLEALDNPFERLDPQLASESRTLMEAQKARVEERLLAEEERLFERGPREPIPTSPEVPEGGAADYIGGWHVAHGEQAVQWLAVNRELAIRERGKPHPELDSGEVRQIGTGGLRPAPPPREVSPADAARLRNQVIYRPALERVENSLGPERTGRLKERIEPVAEWAARRETPWLRQRIAELGALDEGLDSKASFEVLWLERRAELAAEAGATEELEPIRARLDQLLDEGTHPDAWLSANEGRLLRAAAYRDELEIRRQLEVEVAVEAALQEPPERIQVLLGSRPSKESSGTQLQWETLVSALERKRIDRETAAREGFDPPEPPPGGDRRLRDSIAGYRDKAGMLPLYNEIANELGIDDSGFEL